MSPTERTLKLLREEGYTAQVVERWNSYARKRVDLFGFIDIVAVHPTKGILGIQATSASNTSERVKKSKRQPAFKLWKRVANFEVWGWSKKGKKGKQKLWTVNKIKG